MRWGARRHERSGDRVDTRADHYERKLETQATLVANFSVMIVAAVV
jgi:hypothetical protein